MTTRLARVTKGRIPNVDIEFFLAKDYGFGDGIEDVTTASSLKEIRSDYKAHRENEGGYFRYGYRYVTKNPETGKLTYSKRVYIA